MSAAHTQCRYLRRSGEQCTAEALDSTEAAEILLCGKHAGLVMELVRRQAAMVRLTRKVGGQR